MDKLLEEMQAEIKSKCGGKLRLRFVGLDGWDRPIFKDDALPDMFFGDTGHLFTQKVAVLNFYGERKNLDGFLTYFGSSFGCEPWGIPLTGIEIEFVGD